MLQITEQIGVFRQTAEKLIAAVTTQQRTPRMDTAADAATTTTEKESLQQMVMRIEAELDGELSHLAEIASPTHTEKQTVTGRADSSRNIWRDSDYDMYGD